MDAKYNKTKLLKLIGIAVFTMAIIGAGACSYSLEHSSIPSLNGIYIADMSPKIDEKLKLGKSYKIVVKVGYQFKQHFIKTRATLNKHNAVISLRELRNGIEEYILHDNNGKEATVSVTEGDGTLEFTVMFTPTNENGGEILVRLTPPEEFESVSDVKQYDIEK